MIIGIDLGGTNIRVGLKANGSVITQRQALFKEKDSLPSTLRQLIDLIAPMVNPDVKGIGIGVPSVVDREKGIVYNVANIPSWERVELKDILQKEFKVPVEVNNDVNCYVIGEHRFGVAKSFRSVIGMAIGTGLGAGIIINNEIYYGNNCGAGEVGLLPYLDKNIEYYCSGNFFHAIHGTTALKAYQQALSGDIKAKKLWDEFGYHFGNAIKAVVYAYDPEAIILGGSISKAYSFFERTMKESINDFCFPESIKKLKILRSQNDSITLLGAASLIK